MGGLKYLARVLGAVLVFMIVPITSAFAQSQVMPVYVVVAACPGSYTVGNKTPIYIDQTGKFCPGQTISISGSVTSNQGTQNAGGALAWFVRLLGLDNATVASATNP